MYQKYIKSPLDKILAFFILIITLPITGFIAILIKMESGSPILFIQDRTGKDGINFKMLKFRSMTHGNDVRDSAKENQMTKMGKIVRKLSIDELPQLINILRGEMSFIGPRPWIPEYYKCMSEEQRQRNSVLPGITGLAQARGRNDLTIHEKIAFDLGYARRISAREDLKIIFLTAVTVLKKSGQEISKLGIHQELDVLASDSINANRYSERG